MIQWKDETGKVYDVTKIPLDFVASQSLRRFGVPLFKEFSADGDNGWEVTPDVLNSPGQTATMKLYLKFHTVEGNGDTTYPTELDAQKKPKPSTDAANWQPAGNHKLQISIAEVMRKVATSKQVQVPKNDGTPLLDKNNKPVMQTEISYHNALLKENSDEVSDFVFFVDEDGYLIDKD